MILKVVPEGLTVGGFTLHAQQAAVRRLKAKGYAAGTIKRALGAAKAAVNWAWNNGEIDRPIPFLRLPEGAGRERVLSVAELARLWDSAMPDHLRVFLALGIATAGRPEALLQLTRDQCDIDRRTINLNPIGRIQTKKRRPILPMPDWVVPWIAQAKGPIVAYRGKPVRKLAGAFQTMRDVAGFEHDVTAYTIRHSIATELAARSVPEMEIAAILGHGMPNMRTTGRYVHVAPERLARARKALDEIANDIRRLSTRPIDTTALRASSVPVLSNTGGNPCPKSLKSGAGDGIRTHDPNLGKILLLCANLDIACFSDARNAGFRGSFRSFPGHCPRSYVP
jgi:integrase